MKLWGVLFSMCVLASSMVWAEVHPAVLDVVSVEHGQAVVVTAVPGVFQAELSAWQRKDQGWVKILGLWSVVVGRVGFAPVGEKREGDGRTPSGIFSLRRTFGRAPSVSTGLTYQQMTSEDRWVDDVTSSQYNTLVHGVPQANSFEEMLRADGLYDLGAVIEYNTAPIVAGLGSAIFLHIWREDGAKPTAGCVALAKENVRSLLAWLDAEKAPVIILGKDKKEY